MGKGMEVRAIDCGASGLEGLCFFLRADSGRAERIEHQKPDAGHAMLIAMCDGIQPMQLANRDIVLRGGDVLLIRSGDECELPGGICYPSSYFALEIDLSAPALLGMGSEMTRRCTDALWDMKTGLYTMDRGFSELLDAAFEHIQSGDSALQLAGRGELMHAVLSTGAMLQPLKQRNFSPVILRALNYINDMIGMNPTIEDSAKAAGLSVPYFKAQFRKEIGTTPQYYINWRRIALGKRMIAQNYPVHETAILLNFNSSEYFSTLFRRITGRTPTEYRQMVESERAKQQHVVQDEQDEQIKRNPIKWEKE